MILPLVYYGNPILRKKALEITEITDEIRKLASDMIETMDHNNGVGLAAVQIGRLIRLFVMRHYIEKEDGHVCLSEPQVFINPKLSSPSTEAISDTEGCLSIPGIRGDVVRPRSIAIEATDLEGNVFRQELEGYHARIVMHEIDHLNGTLFIDRLDRKSKYKIAPLLKIVEKKYNTNPR